MPDLTLGPEGTHPADHCLSTGDLLFPRAPDTDHESAPPMAPLVRRALQLRNQLEGSAAPGPRLSQVLGGVTAAQLQADQLDLAAMRALLRRQVALEQASSTQGVLEMAGPIGSLDLWHLVLAARILYREFSDIAEDWLGLSIYEFALHPLARTLLAALRGELGGQGFAPGHVSMALRLRNGRHADDGELYVIEANATDFNNYRVGLHRYRSEADAAELPPGAAAERREGWLAYRLARGDRVWAARHASLRTGDARSRLALQAALVDQAQRLLSRPYGFFEAPAFGDTQRLYCSEFVQVAYTAAAAAAGGQLDVQDRRTWQWALDNATGSEFDQRFKDDVMVSTLDQPSIYDRVGNRPFFILAVKMLWNSAYLTERLSPQGQGGYM